MSDFFLIAEVKDVYNSDGSVIIKSFSDFPERFSELKKVFVDYFGEKKEISLDFTKIVDKKIVFKFHRFNSQNDVEFLLGKKLYVSSADLYKLPEDSFYVHDLIDCKIYFKEEFFGILIDVLKLTNNDVYVIKSKDRKEIMIPAIRKFFDSFLTDDKKLFLSSEGKQFFDDEN